MEGVIVNVLNHSAVSKKTRDDTGERLLEDIDTIRLQIAAAESHFSELTDNDLIEANVYEIKSLTARYNYLLREAKRLGATRELKAAIEASDI